MRFHHGSLLLSVLACAQAPPSDGVRDATSAVAGLDSAIWCFHEALGGDVWFGSNGGGVYRQSRERLVQYTLEDGLPGMQVRSIVDDGRGGLLISTTDGVCRFDGKGFTTLEIEESSGANGWRLDPGDVWLVVAPGVGGPCRYDGEKLYRLELTESPAAAAFRRKYPQTSFRPDGVYCTYKDRRGHVWIGTAAVGLCRYDGETLAWMYEERLTTTPSGGAFGIRSIYEDSSGDFWICNTRQRFEVSHEASVVGEHTLLQYEAKAGLPDAQLDGDDNFFYFASMIEDDEGSLWMTDGTDGLYEYDGKSVVHFPIGDGAYSLGVQRGPDGRLWVSTLEHGIYTFDGERLEPL